MKALIFDSLYDSYKGVIVFCRIMEGTVKKGTAIRMMATGAEAEVVEVGYFGAGQFIPSDELSAGMVGYITASIKNVRDTRVGDTITDRDRPCDKALPGYKKVLPMVYCGMYPRTEPSTRISGTPWKNCSSTTPPCSSSRRPPSLWALASAAASWAFCIWRSSRSAWSGNITWTW